jgi:hypothetical protein
MTTRGRPLTMDVKNNKDYFKNYYHKTNEDLICDKCGACVKIHSLRRHLLSKKHIYVSQLINNIKENVGDEIKEN